MGRKSHALVALQNQTLDRFTDELTPDMQNAMLEIDTLLADYQAASIMAYWRVGKLISEVESHPDRFLTEAQQAAQVNAGALLMHLFEQVYTPEQLRQTQRFYDAYPEETAVADLINLRCPDRPRWRLTASHVQALLEIKDPDQRDAIIEKCAEEAFTARDLALEVQELRGKKKEGGRTHSAPKGLKQQVNDLLQHQRRFIKRSESLWLNDDGVYDAVMNAPPDKLTDTVVGYVREIVDNFNKMTDIVVQHETACRRMAERIEAHDAAARDGTTIDAENTPAEEDFTASAKSAALAAIAAAKKTGPRITR